MTNCGLAPTALCVATPVRTTIVLLACLSFLTTACDRRAPSPGAPAASAESPSEPGPPGPSYSPFVVEVEGGDLAFDHISFKDVGMSLPEEERSFVYEELAQSLTYELMSHPEAPLTSRVRYSARMADPANHRHCEGRHVYVDLWHSGAASRWGYSLWSGCGESDRFEWREVPDGDRDVTEVARHIATSLRSAVETGCFTAHC